MKTIAAFALFSTFGAGLLSAEPTSKVGVFDKRALVVAYYRSPQFASLLKEKRQAMEAAKAAGDTAKAASLEKWGQASQDLAHRQLAGSAPVDSILEALKPQLADLAARASVQEIVADAKPGQSKVDVTEQLLELLKADDKTRKVIEEVRAAGHNH